MEAAIPMNTQPYVEPGAREAERQYAMFNHIVGIASVASWGVPLLGFFAVMAMWLIRKADSPYLDDHGREAMNFQISLIFYYIILMIPLSIVTFGLWAIFVPVLMQVGMSPELTQAAYRVGDSSTNIITPLMPYFPLVVAYCQRWVTGTGIGTVTALMLPFSIAFLVGWSLFLLAFWAVGIPLGLAATYTYP